MSLRIHFRWLALVVASLVVAPSHAQVNGKDVTGLAFTPDGKTVIASSGNEVRFLDPATSKELRRFTAHEQFVSGLALSPDGKRLATAGAGGSSVRVWDTASGKELHALGGNKELATAVAFSPDGKMLASATADAGVIRLWDFQSDKPVRSIPTGDTWAMSLAFSSDGKRIYTAGSTMNALTPGLRVNDGDEARAWDVDSGKNVSRAPAKGTSIAVAPDGGVLAIGGFGLIQVGPTEPANIRINQIGLRSLHRTTLWSLSANREIMHLDGLGTVALSPDGRYLAAARGSERNFRSRGGIHLGGAPGNAPPQLIEVATGKSALPLTPPAGVVTMVAFSPDARRLALGMNDGAVHFLNLAPAGFDPEQFKKMTPEQITKQWDILGGDNASGAHAAIWTLSVAGDAALAPAAERLRPRKADSGRIAQLLKDLESRRFGTRDAAFKELQKLGDAAEPEIRQALKGQPSVDARKKLEELAAVFDQVTLNGERLLQSRGILLLERIASARAPELLQELARDHGEAYVSREARSALKRMDAQRATGP